MAWGEFGSKAVYHYSAGLEVGMIVLATWC
jgi:hypothetical protein